MKSYFAVVSMFLIFVPFLMFGAKATAKQSKTIDGGNWPNGWLYRKPHNITGSPPGDQVNYQVLISINYGYGADSQGDVYLGQDCRMDFGDIRFTDSSGVNPLNYYIESEVSGVQASIWVKVSMIPAGTQTQIYIYYGNQNASTTSNKDLTFPSASDFEDGTRQGWTISWTSCVTSDGTDNASAYEGNYKRLAGRRYGVGEAGTGEFYQDISKTSVYLASGSYSIQGAACFVYPSPYYSPKDVKLMVDGYVVNQINTTGTNWQSLSGTFSLNSSRIVTLSFEFHLSVSGGLSDGEEAYRIDSVYLRSWCNPEPTQGTWGTREAVIVPEFPSLIILSLFIIMTLLAAIVFRKRTRKECERARETKSLN